VIKRLILFLLILGYSPVVFAQIVTPGGGNTGAGQITGGSCTGGQFQNGMNTNGTPQCATVTGGSGYPPGAPAQIGGFAATNTSEAETVGGDATYTRASANNYTLTVTKTNGSLLTGMATAAIPLSILNGGTGITTAPSAGQLLIGQTATTYGPKTLSGDATINSSGVISVATVAGVAPGPLYSVASPLPVANGGTGLNTATAAGDIPVAQTATSYLMKALSGDATMTLAGVVTVTKINGITPGGVCGGGQFASTISSSGVPTCTTPGASVPAGTLPQFVGYAGVNTGEAETLSGDATLTRASAGSYTIAVTKTGGVAFTGLATAAIPLSIANGGLGNTTAPSAGMIDIAQSATLIQPKALSGDATITSAGAITVTKTNGTAFGAAATLGVGTNLASSGGNINLASPVNNLTTSGTLTFPDGATAIAQGLSNLTHLAVGAATPNGAFKAGQADALAVYSPGGTSFSAGLGGVFDGWLSTASPPVAGGNITWGMYNNGTNWLATAKNIDHMAVNTGEIGWFMYENQTVGSAPTSYVQYMALRDSSAGSGQGLFLTQGQFIATSASGGTGAGGLCIGCTSASTDDITVNENFNGGARIVTQNSSHGTSSQALVSVINDNGVIGGFGVTGHSSTFGGSYPPDTVYWNGSGTNTLNMAIAAGGAIPNGQISIWPSGYGASAFLVRANQFEGLSVCGYAGMFCTANVAGLGVGNSYLSAQTFANLNISGGAYFNDGTGQWVTDGGAGNGVGLASQVASGWSFYTSPGGAAGVNVAWTRQGLYDGNGFHVTNIMTDGGSAAPTFTNCGPMAGSRDSFGYCNVSAWPITITFSRPFSSGVNIGCVANGGAGSSGLLYTLNQNNGSIQIGCVNYAGGPVCGGMWIQYMCFGVG